MFSLRYSWFQCILIHWANCKLHYFTISNAINTTFLSSHPFRYSKLKKKKNIIDNALSLGWKAGAFKPSSDAVPRNKNYRITAITGIQVVTMSKTLSVKIYCTSISSQNFFIVLKRLWEYIQLPWSIKKKKVAEAEKFPSFWTFELSSTQNGGPTTNRKMTKNQNRFHSSSCHFSFWILCLVESFLSEMLFEMTLDFIKKVVSDPKLKKKKLLHWLNFTKTKIYNVWTE